MAAIHLSAATAAFHQLSAVGATAFHRANASIAHRHVGVERRFFRYASPLTNLSFTLCACAKCGTTSLYLALHRALTGHDFQGGPPWVQDFERWGVPGVSVASSPGLLHFQVGRRPHLRCPLT